MNFIWIVTFNSWKFKSTSFGPFKQFDCDSMGFYYNNNLLHKNEYLFKYYRLSNVGNHFNPL